MLWIGLTGGLGSGKSTAAKLIRDQGITVIDADEMSRLAVCRDSVGLTKVVGHFGSAMLKSDGELDRAQLAAQVFRNPNALLELEAIVHPIVQKLTEERRAAAEKRGDKIAFYDVPLLFEKKMQNRFSKTVVVNASLEDQISRTIKRDGLSRDQVLQRMKNQIPLDHKVQLADFVLENTKGVEDLKLQVKDLLSRLLKTP